ncbi:tRNA glutamyl-Q(34) synthetase GluQRS [Serratia microhaemolytica]|uniref:tRNA glutamyl-Q(34) synthetase GluQRS n=1 Tax=Serratia microhaemolytica TaxID=2675110 RepID=UPI000FDDBF57|nr:tRNA glutamyl-Q(34) synthetase GluQRS [Serratia microhaemolytica]
MLSARYVGRFAPSPSGDLHFGSLVTALGSYLQARAQQGLWLVRIEDLDPPREIPGSAQRILTTLERYGLNWDGSVLYQSQRHEAYRAALDWLQQQHLTYYCTCRRSRIQQLGGYYDGHCRDLDIGAEGAAVRLRQLKPVYHFHDQRLGLQCIDAALAREEFVLRRRDGLFAYNLAVVVDDHFQGVNQVVRGADLIAATVWQMALYQQLQWPVPSYVHLPLVLADNAVKLSKQNHAPALPAGDPRPVLVRALHFLHQPVADNWQDLNLSQLLASAIVHWQLQTVPKQAGCLV